MGLGRWDVDCVVRIIEMDRIPYSPINNIKKTFEHAQVRFDDDDILCVLMGYFRLLRGRRRWRLR